MVVSMAGLLICVPAALHVGAEVRLTVCPHRTVELSLPVRAVHRRRQPDGLFRYGVTILDLTADEQQRLRSAIQLFTKGWTDPLAPYAAELTCIG